VLKALHQRIHALALHLWREHNSPPRMAAAVWLGCVVGCTPLFGLHIWVCIALAWLLRLNQVVVYAAANISIPPIAPFIGFISVQLGERLLHGGWMALELSDFTWRNAPSLGARFFVNWMVGGLLLGAAVGLVGGLVTWVALSRRRERQRVASDPVWAALVAASSRYRSLPRRFRFYAHMKFRMDPCYHAIASRVGPDTLTVDLGTGLGMLPVLLGELGDGRRAVGVEWDAAKAQAGALAAAGLSGVEILEGDLHTFELPPCDVVTLVDVLHYYGQPEQRAIIARCARALRPGGAAPGPRERPRGVRRRPAHPPVRALGHAAGLEPRPRRPLPRGERAGGRSPRSGFRRRDDPAGRPPAPGQRAHHRERPGRDLAGLTRPARTHFHGRPPAVAGLALARTRIQGAGGRRCQARTVVVRFRVSTTCRGPDDSIALRLSATRRAVPQRPHARVPDRAPRDRAPLGAQGHP
jgi:uncharacterized protein (DUF2062 family)/SAM-dependent methyltransferase